MASSTGVLSKIINRLKKYYYQVVPLSSALKQLQKNNKIVVLMYHEVLRGDVESWTVVEEKSFIQQMTYLKENFRLLSIDDALLFSQNGAVVDGDDRPLAVVTFDDGYAGNLHVMLPIINELEIPVTIYVSTLAVEQGSTYWYDRIINVAQSGAPIKLDLSKHGLGCYNINACSGSENWKVIQQLLTDLKGVDYKIRTMITDDVINQVKAICGEVASDVTPLRQMSIDDVKSIACHPLVTIGAHSHCHNILVQLPHKEAEQSVKKSKALLEEWTGQAVTCFAYPNGNYNEELIGIVRDAGFVSAVTTEAGEWTSEDCDYSIPRRSVGRYDSFSYFKVNVAGVLPSLRKL